MAEKRPALGRGLSALIPDAPLAPPASVERSLDVDIDLLRPNKFQPRTHMDDARIEDLSRSIKSNGVIQPIVVRKTDSGYEIVAGERRWRASQRAGLLKVPVVVRDIPDERLLAAALIENIQREDLNPIEEAVAYRRLADEFALTQEQIAESVGKDRSSIANYVRLLKLPASIRDHVASGTLSMGHARALLSLPDEAAQLRLGKDIVDRALSVRETETLVKRTIDPPPAKPETQKDVHTRAAEERLRFSLGTRVRIIRKGKGGRIEVDFGDENELHRLYEQLTEKK
jgi:ParB family chromosome partitioning protein